MLSLRVECNPAMTQQEVASEAVRLARLLDCWVVVEANGLDMMAHPSTSPQEVWNIWKRELDIRRQRRAGTPTP